MAACRCQPNPSRASGADKSDKTPRPHGRWASIVFVAVLVAGTYVAYQRIGTTANVDTITFAENYAGGFIAVGMSDRQPGFIALSALDRTDLRIEADKVEQGLAGRHTNVRVTTPQAQWQKRLRGPRIVLINSDGAVESLPIEWTRADFTRVLEGLDCGHEKGKQARACGQPFSDLRHTLEHWPEYSVPEKVRRFLKHYDAHRHMAKGSDPFALKTSTKRLYLERICSTGFQPVYKNSFRDVFYKLPTPYPWRAW